MRQASEKGADDVGFGVYVHWPFCAQKCPYCDFNSHVRFGGIDEARFRSAFLRELEHTAKRTGPRVVSSIFFGGGTPSLMAPETVAAKIIKTMRALDLSRFNLKYSNGTLPHAVMKTSIELIGTMVAPRVREAMG